MEDNTPEKTYRYRVTITRVDPSYPPINRSYILNDALCRQLSAGKRVVVEIEDGDCIKATMKGKEDANQA